jgi:DNA-directed RNA polymerase II subunit RPB1
MNILFDFNDLLKSPLNRKYRNKEGKRIHERIKVVPGDDLMRIEAQKNATLFFKILLQSTFSSKHVMKEYQLKKETFEWIVGEIKCCFL